MAGMTRNAAKAFRSEPGSSSWPNWSIFTGVAKTKMVAVEHSEDVTLGNGAGIAEFTQWGTGQEPHEPDYLAMATLTLVR